MKAKRQAILKARLAKVKQKKLNRQGLLPEGKEIGAGMSEDLNGKVCSISGASHLEDETRVSDEPKGSQNLDAATASGQNHLNVQTTTFESTNARKKGGLHLLILSFPCLFIHFYPFIYISILPVIQGV